jgi:sterol desaturase/sphingolipid hydroxylase (fatty acid hydroxylase superfamily)
MKFPIWDLLLGTFRASPREAHETMPLGLEELRGPEVDRLGFLFLSLRRRLGRPRTDARELR